MKIKYNVYYVRDMHENEDGAVALDSCDSVQICGMKNKDGESVYFESEAYHLSTWCRENDLLLTVEEKTEIIPNK